MQLSFYLHLSFLLEASLSFQFNIMFFEGHPLDLYKKPLLVHVQNRPDRYVFQENINQCEVWFSRFARRHGGLIPRQLLRGLSATETPCIKHLSKLRTRFHADTPPPPPPPPLLPYPPSLCLSKVHPQNVLLQNVTLQNSLIPNLGSFFYKTSILKKSPSINILLMQRSVYKNPLTQRLWYLCIVSTFI